MKEVQTIQGLPSLDSEGSILFALAKQGIIRLPTIVHQAMADAIDREHNTLEENQAKLKKLLLDYIEEEHPKHELASFIELLREDAKKISLYLPWGIYVKLIPRGHLMEYATPIEDAMKQLSQ